MRPENEARLRKIRWISGILRAICTVFLVLLCVCTLLWTVMGLMDPEDGSIGARLVAVGLIDVLMGLTFKCGYHLYRLLGNYSRGEIFTKGSAEQIRQWGIACALLGAVKFGCLFVPIAVFREYSSPGQGLGSVVNGLIIVAISWFMAMAAEMREEQDLIV